jgi:hypothetical protein
MERSDMRKIIILGLCLLGIGCSSIQKPAWISNADFLTDSPHSFFTKPDDIDSKGIIPEK